MKEQLEKWKELLKDSGKNRWIVFLLAGLLLLVISIPNGEEQKLPAAQAEVADEKTLDQAETLAAGLERVLSRVRARRENKGPGDFKIRWKTSGGKGQFCQEQFFSRREQREYGCGKYTGREHGI